MSPNTVNGSIKGLTLIELLVTITILAILAGVGIPAFDRILDRRRVIGATDNLLADLRNARSESIKNNADVAVVFTPGNNWNYTTVGGTLETASNSTNYLGTSMTIADEVEDNPSIGANRIIFSAKRGMATPTLAAPTRIVTFTSARGAVTSIVMDPVSNLSLCTTTQTGGYPACN